MMVGELSRRDSRPAIAQPRKNAPSTPAPAQSNCCVRRSVTRKLASSSKVAGSTRTSVRTTPNRRGGRGRPLSLPFALRIADPTPGSRGKRKRRDGAVCRRCAARQRSGTPGSRAARQPLICQRTIPHPTCRRQANELPLPGIPGSHLSTIRSIGYARLGSLPCMPLPRVLIMRHLAGIVAILFMVLPWAGAAESPLGKDAPVPAGRLIQQLGDANPVVREKATQALEALGAAAIPAL